MRIELDNNLVVSQGHSFCKLLTIIILNIFSSKIPNMFYCLITLDFHLYLMEV